MKPKPPAHPDSVNARLSNYLNAQRAAIVEDWTRRAARDPDIPTESLSSAELKGHLPALFNDLEATLRYYGNESVAELAEKDAAEHGMARWIQGFSLPEMLREIAHLRSSFFVLPLRL